MLTAGINIDQVEEELHGGRPCIYFDNDLSGHLFQACFVAVRNGFRGEPRAGLCAAKPLCPAFGDPFSGALPVGRASYGEAKSWRRSSVSTI
jgi:hypothetical protein